MSLIGTDRHASRPEAFSASLKEKVLPPAEIDLASLIRRGVSYVREINPIHPFREGKGRAIGFHLDVLSAGCA